MIFDDQEIPEDFNPHSRLPWTRFNWCAISTRPDATRMMVYGTTKLERRPTEIQLRTRILGAAAKMSEEVGIVWDPFNLQLVITPAINQD